MRREAGGVAEKPGRGHHKSLTARARVLAAQAPAGDISPNFVAHGARPRGTGEVCRYHSTYSLGFNIEGAGLNDDEKMSLSRNENTPEIIHKVSDPLSCDKMRHEARRMMQDIMSKSADQFVDSPASKPRAGWERPHHPDAALTEAFRTRDLMRFSNPVKPREAPAPAQASYRARQDCRFHEPPSPRSPRTRSYTPDGGRAYGGLRDQKNGANGYEPGYAGRSSDSHLRHDTPGGQECSLGRVRSLTPDYHRRYGTNLVGSSLPGSRAAAASEGDSPLAQDGRRASISNVRMGASACDPNTRPLTSSVHARNAVRYHNSAPEDAHSFGRRHSPRHAPDSTVAGSMSSSLRNTPRRGEGHGPAVPLCSRGGGGGGSPAVTSWQSFAESPRGAAAGYTSPSRRLNRKGTATGLSRISSEDLSVRRGSLYTTC